jgi:hypothetical protein
MNFKGESKETTWLQFQILDGIEVIMEVNLSYDRTLFISSQSDHLECPICFNIMKDPVQCPSEGHTFCRHCISIHLSQTE